MSNRWSVRIILALLLPVVLVATLVPATKMQQYLYGKWHQERAPYVTETVFKQDSTFTSITVQKGAAYRLYVEGTWEIRGTNELWMEWKYWEPRDLRKPLPEGTPVQVIDHNHFRNKLGDVYRVQ